MGAEADAFHFHPYLIIWYYFSLKIKIICCILISKGSLNMFIYKRDVYNLQALLYAASIEMHSFTSSFLCVFVFFFFFWRLRFFAFSFFFFAFPCFCVFVLWNMRLRSLKYASRFFSKNENDVNLAVASTVNDFFFTNTWIRYSQRIHMWIKKSSSDLLIFYIFEPWYILYFFSCFHFPMKGHQSL